ncbi:MAG: alkaline phosphatase [Phycisphaerales bacterium]
MDQSTVTRRAFLAASTAAGAALVAGRPGLAHPRPAGLGGHKTAKAHNLIFMVSDGMSNGTLAIAEHAARITTGKPSHWTRIAASTGTRRALQSTHSANSLVTDSAAASSAWSTGVKHDQGSLCIDPTGKPLAPFLWRAARSGRRVGCVTTTTITHATPGGFYANQKVRDEQPMIAPQLLSRGIDVALGGGARYFPADVLGPEPKVLAVRTAAELAAAPVDGRRLLGIFAENHLAFALERPPTQPSLQVMARAAIDRLSASPQGFVLQIEAGRVDHAAHSNDAFALLREQLEFDETLGMVAEWVRGRTDTLLIMTTDHATANPGLTLYGKDGNTAFPRLLEGKHSFEWITDEVAAAVKADAGADRHALFISAIKAATGVALSSSESAHLRRFLAKERTDGFLTRNTLACTLGGVLANACGISFVSPNHTSDFVELMALGPGSETLPGFIDNIEVTPWMAAALDLAPAEAPV